MHIWGGGGAVAILDPDKIGVAGGPGGGGGRVPQHIYFK